MTFPKIELHVHFEGTVRPETLLAIARRNRVTLPSDTVEGLQELYRFRDFAHFIEVFLLTTAALRTADDFRQIVSDYAGEAAAHGCVYIEGIFSPTQQVRRGVRVQEVFEGYCDGIEDARARHGVEVRLTPDITRGGSVEETERTVRQSIAFRDRGVVGVGLGGLEADFPPQLYAREFAIARAGGLGSVPHAGEVVGPESIWGALEHLHADRIRHGIRAVDDPALVRELAARGTVLDACLVSNLRTGIVGSLDAHPIRTLIAAGVRCTLSTDDPPMFETDLTLEYETAARLGLSPRAFYDAGLAGALCDEATRARLTELREAYDWGSEDSSASTASALS